MVLLGDDTKSDILSTVNVSADHTRGMRPKVRATQLQTVLEIIEELSNAIDPGDVLPQIIETLFRSFRQSQNGYVLLRNLEMGEFEPTAVRRSDGQDDPIVVSRVVVDEVVRNRTAVLSVESIRSDGGDGEHAGHPPSGICAPLIGRDGEILGLIQLEVVDGKGRFTDKDLDVLAGVARHVALVIESSCLHDAALRAQKTRFEARFRRLIEGSVQGIIIHRDFQPLFVNKAWAHLHGFTVDEVLGMRSVLDLVASDDQQRATEYASARIRGGPVPDRYEARAVRKDGSLIWLEEFSTSVEWEGGAAIQTAVVDITARKRAEEILRRGHDDLERRIDERAKELAEANRRLNKEIEERRQAVEDLKQSVALYHSLVDHIPLSVARKDLSGRFIFVNRALCEMFHLDTEQITGKIDFDLSPRDMAEKYRRDDELVAKTGELLETYEKFTNSDGQQSDIHTLKTPIYDTSGNIAGTQLIFSNVSSIKRTEEEKRRYAAELERSNQELEQFAYSVSHDLQTPLKTVTSYCELLQRRYHDKLDAEANEFLAVAADGALRLKRLLDDLLAYSRVSTDKSTVGKVDVAEAVDETLHNLKAVVLETRAEVTHDELPTLTASATQLMQLFQNLVGNAIRYRSEEAPRIHISSRELNDAWEFQVQDDGLGIDVKHFDRIFQIFQRLHAEQEISGAGVGLSICKRIIERHGGRIWVRSKCGEGSCFCFTLPKTPLAN